VAVQQPPHAMRWRAPPVFVSSALDSLSTADQQLTNIHPTRWFLRCMHSLGPLGGRHSRPYRRSHVTSMAHDCRPTSTTHSKPSLVVMSGASLDVVQHVLAPVKSLSARTSGGHHAQHDVKARLDLKSVTLVPHAHIQL
jgi:hypothetical protein